jgi:glycosyltransferase involved in cell wall biosynthesis
MRTLVIIPTHDEAANIGTLLDRLAVNVPDVDVLVVDDASTDGTADIVRSHGRDPNVRVSERTTKLGLGDAYRHGFHIALDEGYDAVVEIDADLSHDPQVLPTMLDVASHGIDVVIGSRYIPGGGVDGWSRRRTWLSRWGNRYAALVLGLAINDATSGYRVYRTDALGSLGLDDVQADGYGFQIEMTYRAVCAGCTVVEIPIRFRDREAGASKMSGGIIREAFGLVTWWGILDAITLRRRRRAYDS